MQFRGSCLFRQYTLAKPTKYGIQDLMLMLVLVLVLVVVVLLHQVYTGKSDR
jgi:hypothetical protein